MRKLLDGNIGKDTRQQLKQVFKDNPDFTNSSVGKATGVNYQIIKRIREGKPATDKTLDKIGKWIKDNNL